jgi:hypothetical protein
MSYPMWNPAKTGILVDRGNGVLAFLENGSEFDSVKPIAADWHEVPDPEPEPIPIEEQRAAMRCRAAAMRLVLFDAGKLDAVQAVADSDPRASIVWEYEPEYSRNDPFVNALGVELFTPEEIDDLFRAAMQL